MNLITVSGFISTPSFLESNTRITAFLAFAVGMAIAASATGYFPTISFQLADAFLLFIGGGKKL